MDDEIAFCGVHSTAAVMPCGPCHAAWCIKQCWRVVALPDRVRTYAYSVMGFYDDLEVSNPEGENLETDANYHGPASEVLPLCHQNRVQLHHVRI